MDLGQNSKFINKIILITTRVLVDLFPLGERRSPHERSE